MAAVGTDCVETVMSHIQGPKLRVHTCGLGRSLSSETPSGGHPFVTVLSQVRNEDRGKTDSGQVGFCELSPGYGSQASKTYPGRARPVVIPNLYWDGKASNLL